MLLTVSRMGRLDNERGDDRPTHSVKYIQSGSDEDRMS